MPAVPEVPSADAMEGVNVHAVGLVLVAVSALNLGLGLYVLVCNPRAARNQYFALFSASVALWTLSVALVTSLEDPSRAFMWIAFSAASLIPVGLALTLEALPKRGHSCPSYQTLVLTLMGFMFAALPHYIVQSVDRVDGTFAAVYGPLHPAFCTYVVVGFALAARILYRLYRTSDRQQRLQVKYLSLGVLVSALLATVTNVVLPFAFGTSRASIYGPLAGVLMLAMIAHAIVRHRLMDVGIFIKQGSVYLFASLIAGLLLLLLIVGSSAILHEEHRIPIREILLAVFVALLFNPLKTWIKRAADRYLYREPYDYATAIREASRALRRTIDLPVLLERVGSILDKTLRPEWYAIFLLEEEGTRFHWIAGRNADLLRAHEFQFGVELVEHSGRELRPSFRDDFNSEPSAIPKELSVLKADGIVPLATEARVIGFLVVGPKRSGDPYFTHDADLLSTLADQSSVAIRNAQTHQQVLEANEYIQRILGTIENGVIAVNARGRIRLFNRAAESMTGGREETLRGQPIGHLPMPLSRLIEATLDDGQGRTQSEFALPDGSGQLVPLMVSTSALRGPHRALVGAVAVVSDLSRLKELEKEKRRAEHLAAVESIASGLAHEIQNPLVAIKTFTQLLPSRGIEPGFNQRAARIMNHGIVRIENLVQRMRALGTTSAQPMEPVDITQPLRATLDLLGPQIEERRIRLRYVADGTPRAILGNASQLEQLFLNVCLNAVEAMEPGGELTVRVADLCAAGGVTLLVEVCDTGTGIAEDILPTIFNPFVTTKARGSGLGLAICRSIADAHRAALSARNNTGRPGSTFTIEFPVPTGSAASLLT